MKVANQRQQKGKESAHWNKEVVMISQLEVISVFLHSKFRNSVQLKFETSEILNAEKAFWL